MDNVGREDMSMEILSENGKTEASTRPLLFRVWEGDSNDRSEVARIIASDLESALKYVRENLIDWKGPIEEEDDGFSVTVCNKSECWKTLPIEDRRVVKNSMTMCEECGEPQTRFVQLEEVSDWTIDDASYKCMDGKDYIYDLTKNQTEPRIWNDDLFLATALCNMAAAIRQS